MRVDCTRVDGLHPSQHVGMFSCGGPEYKGLSIMCLTHGHNTTLTQGSYRQVCVKFKDFSRTSKRLSYCFHGLKTYEKY